MAGMQERWPAADPLPSESFRRSPGASARPARGAARGVAAAVKAAGGSAPPIVKKRSFTTGTSNSADTGPDADAEVTGSARKARRTSSTAAGGPSRTIGRPDNLRESALLALIAGADRESADSDDASPAFACDACGLSCKSGRGLSEHFRKSHGGFACARRRKTAPASPRSGSPCSDTFEARDIGASSGRDRASQVAPGKGAGVKSGGGGPARKGSGGRAGPKRPSSLAATAAGRTRPTNNQLLYKASFRWQHYPYKVRGTSPLPAETEACASVTTAFLQVLQSLYEAESRREDSPRNILQILSTNTRRTKVVELSSGTHRVPDELRKHCLTDSDGGEYSTNLDRNRYGSDNQYLNTVIQFDLDFLGLCPSLVDVEIIDAKNDEKSILIQADRMRCNCGCGDDSHAGHDNVPVAEGGRMADTKHPAPNSGIFDMLLLAATGEASACSDGSADDEDEAAGTDDGASNEHAHSQNSGQMWRDEEDMYPDEEVAPKPFPARLSKLATGRQGSANTLTRAASPAGSDETAKLKEALRASRLRAIDLEAQLAASARKISHSEEALVHSLEESEAKAADLQAEVERLRAVRAEADETIATLKARADKSLLSSTLQSRCSDLETRLAAVVRERDAHAQAHSYYAVWVQQLQTEVTNLLKAAHNGNSSVVSPQLVALTQSMTPVQPTASHVAAPAPARAQPLEAEAALRAQYEQQVQELLQKHIQGMQASQAAAAATSFPAAQQQLALQQLALPGVVSGGSAAGASALLSTAATTGALLPLEIAPLASAPAIKHETKAPSAAEALMARSASNASSRDTCSIHTASAT